MTGMVPRRLVRWWTGASLMLLAFAVASVGFGQARGGCVHDVPAIAHFEHLVQAGAMPEAEDGPNLPDPTRPCTGPSCSKAPAVPLTPSSSSAFAVEPWACLAVGPEVPAPTPSCLALDSDRALPVRGGSSVFHPPRSSSR